MLSISERTGTMNHRARFHGEEDDDKRALTFQLDGISIERNEINALLQDPHAFESLYDTGANPIAPFLPTIKALELAGNIAGAYVKVQLVTNAAVAFEFTDCDVKKIKLDRQTGGTALMSCRVTTKQAMRANLADLLERLGHAVSIEIRGEAPGAQKDLPLNGHAGDADPTVSGLGRQIQAAAARDARKAKRNAAKPQDAFNH
jgi:hypothetical protein